MGTISWEDFEKVDIRLGKIIEVKYLEDGKYSTHKLNIDFGPDIGVRQSCARLVRYTPEELIGKYVIAIINFPSKQIGKNISGALTLAVPDANGDAVLIAPDSDAPLGSRIY